LIDVEVFDVAGDWKTAVYRIVAQQSRITRGLHKLFLLKFCFYCLRGQAHKLTNATESPSHATTIRYRCG